MKATMLLCAQRNVRLALSVFAIMITEIRCVAAECPHCRETHCDSWNGKPWCGHCAHGFYWVHGTCLACDQNCVYCTPSECSQQCKNMNGKCTMGCKHGYYEYYDAESQVYSCRRCSAPNCRQCDHDSCTSCEDGYFLQGGTCASCNVSQCKTCRSVNDCSSCKDGYYQESENQCYKCNDICQDCYKKNDRIVCMICTDGNNVNPTDTCKKCPQDARTCYPVNGKLEYSNCSREYYGHICQSRCSSECYEEICREGDGYCASCKRNFYGPECNIPCSNGCSDTGEKFDVCERNTGHCTMGCKHDLKGELCDTVDGQWSDWQDWSQCSVTCGQGTQTRERTCKNPVPQNGGHTCYGNDKGSRNCDMSACPAVYGNWLQWSEYSECSTTCGTGTRLRQRSCDIQEPKNSTCEGISWQSDACFESVCSGEPENISLGLVIGAVFGTAIISAFVFTVVFIILRKRRQGSNIHAPEESQNPETQGMEAAGTLHYETLTERPAQNSTYLELETREYEYIDEQSPQQLGSHIEDKRTEYENV